MKASEASFQTVIKSAWIIPRREEIIVVRLSSPFILPNWRSGSVGRDASVFFEEACQRFGFIVGGGAAQLLVFALLLLVLLWHDIK